MMNQMLHRRHTPSDQPIIVNLSEGTAWAAMDPRWTMKPQLMMSSPILPPVFDLMGRIIVRPPIDTHHLGRRI